VKTQSVIQLKPIGWVRAEFKQKFCTPRQGSIAKSSRAWIELDPTWRGRGILSGLDAFSHVWILGHLHLSVQTRQRGKIRPPRLKGAKMGILGSRSPHRPNNIGLTLARLIQVEGDRLEVAEIDLIDGTPVLDLKPYLPEADRPEVFTSGWTQKISEESRAIEFSLEAERDLDTNTTDPTRIKRLIVEMLSNDPRPRAYLNHKEADFFVWVAGLNIKFRFANEQFLVVSAGIS
jgi:tRNA (adenine37-N6)-methyltransferase